jgi:hypothetical protein
MYNHNDDTLSLETESLQFLIDWLQQLGYSKGHTLETLKELSAYRQEIVDWLKENEYITRYVPGYGIGTCPGRPGKPSKRFSNEEIDEAQQRIKEMQEVAPKKRYPEYAIENTISKYGKAANAKRTTYRYKLLKLGIFVALAHIYGLPHRVSPTDFANQYSLPKQIVKNWFSFLIDDERAKWISVRGKRLIHLYPSQGSAAEGYGIEA